MTSPVLILLAGIVAVQDIAAQEPGSPSRTTSTPVETRRNQASVLFDKLLNTYHWIGLGRYKNTVGGFTMDFEERFLSTIIKAERPLIRDEQLFGLLLRQQLYDQLAGVARVSSFALSDDQAVGIGNAASHGIHAGVEYRPHRKIVLEPLLGLKLDHQIDQRDRGVSYLLNLSADDLDVDGYVVNGRGGVQIDRLSPRLLETHADSLVVKKSFFGQTRDSLRVTFNRNRRDFYFAADTLIQRVYNVAQNIETRTDNTIAFSNALDYDISTEMLFSLQGGILTRDISRSTRFKNFLDARRTPLNSTIEELRIEAGLQLQYAGDLGAGAARLFYFERDERHLAQGEEAIPDSILLPFQHQQERKNNHSRRSSLSLDAGLPLSGAHNLELSASTNLMRYDTPSPANDDDRDELTYLFSMTSSHRISGVLHLRLTAEANLSHLVYLAGTRSGDNTWNRILRLSPRLVYTPSTHFSTANRFEVLAHYTAYDFEHLASSIRSFAYRQFAFVDSTTWHLTNRLDVEWFSHIRLYERGELRWQDFSERPLQYFEEKTFVGLVRFRPADHLLFSAGLRYFSQSRYTYTGSERSLESFLRSIGPITTIECQLLHRYHLQFSGWYEHQTVTGLPARGFANMVMSFTIPI